MSAVDRANRLALWLVPCLVFVAAFSLFVATAAPGTLFGDPSEYQFIPAILGIAHPPGYAFYTLLAKLWQILVPVGTIAYRTNLLAAAMGAWVVTAIFLIVRDLELAVSDWRSAVGNWHLAIANRRLPAGSALAPLFAAASMAVAPDLWQHAIHANSHVVSVALASTHLWLLVRWWRAGAEPGRAKGQDRWLAAFAVTLGLAAAHHPITLMGVPAYGLFILAVRPRILREWRTLALLAGCLLLGLTPFLYYPLRSPSVPFGPTDMRTWAGFWRHTTAQGLRVNLFHFGPADQPDRALVFWSLLRLQFSLPVIALMVMGLLGLARRAPKPALLICGFLATHLLFTLNTVQDVMAYLLLPFAALAVSAGVGSIVLVTWVGGLLVNGLGEDRTRIEGRGRIGAEGRAVNGFGERIERIGTGGGHRLPLVIGHWLLVIFLFVWPLAQAALNLHRGISLRNFTAAEEYVATVYDRFAGRGEGAVLLSDWEHLTPLWVHMYTQGKPLAEEDVKLVYVNPANPWTEAVWQHMEEGPIYIVGYRPAVRDAGFRLFPDGPFYRVVAPPVTDVSPGYRLDVWADDRVHILGYDLPTTTVRAGEPLRLALYQGVEEPLEGIWMPYALLGPVEARWTTDSRVLTTQWQPGEVVAEVYEIPVPPGLPAGEYPLRLGYADLSGGRAELGLSNGETTVELATVTVLPDAGAARTHGVERALANLDHQVALTGAVARAGWQSRRGMWEEPLVVQAGQALHLRLTWQALVAPRDSFTIFIHLIDGAGRYVYGHDYTPLGGSCPSYLWFPKWLPGQVLIDPYRLDLPDDLPAGDYWIEVGMYGMTSLRRLPVVDLENNLSGDRVVLGPVRLE